jgi:BRCA1-associated protein
LESDRASSRKEAATASALEGLRERLRVVEREVGVEKAMNKGLLERLRVREGEMKVMREERERERAEWERKMRETEEEVRDLMFFLESREKIEVEGGMLEEGRGGDLLVVTGKGDEVDSVVAGSRVEKKKGEKKKKR